MNRGIEIQNVNFGYKKGINILSNISLGIKKGFFLGITGVNGSGKSTLTYLFNGLIPHFIKGHLTGEILVDGVSTRTQNVAFFAHKVGMVFQNPDFSLFNLTVAEELEFGLDNLKLNNRKDRIGKALKSVNLEGFEDRDPQTLSLGQKQKVCLAAVLALDTEYIVLDEPTAMLDFKSSLELYQILKGLNERGKTIVVVEHDTDFLKQFAKEILIINDGSIFRQGSIRKILAEKEMLAKLGIKIP